MDSQTIKHFNKLIKKSNINFEYSINTEVLEDPYSLVFYKGYEDYNAMKIVSKVVKVYYWNELLNLIHIIDCHKPLLFNKKVKKRTLSKHILDNPEMVDLLHNSLVKQWSIVSYKHFKTTEYIATVLIFNYFVLGKKGEINE